MINPSFFWGYFVDDSLLDGPHLNGIFLIFVVEQGDGGILSDAAVACVEPGEAGLIHLRLQPQETIPIFWIIT